MERIEGLLVDRSIPSSRKRSEPLLFIHGMWGGSWTFENRLRFVASAGWEMPLHRVLEWLERAMK